jgi:hypothetical protein
MNTNAENDYKTLMSDDMLVFETIQTKKIIYNFQFTDEIKKEYENWKLDIFQLTDEKPNKNEILEYFKKLNILSSSTNGNTDVVINNIFIQNLDN